jgi:hypothetical protein
MVNADIQLMWLLIPKQYRLSEGGDKSQELIDNRYSN